jgi:hypothetical protein
VGNKSCTTIPVLMGEHVRAGCGFVGVRFATYSLILQDLHVEPVSFVGVAAASEGAETSSTTRRGFKRAHGARPGLPARTCVPFFAPRKNTEPLFLHGDGSMAPLTSLSNGARLKVRLPDTGLTGSFACALTGVSPTRLSLCLAGAKDLDPDDAAKLFALCDRLSRLQEALKFPLNFRDAAVWKELLQWMDECGAQPEDFGEAVRKVFKIQQ